ncbi:MAG: PadR family transcriptional regulator [Marmoricola sp.]
MANTLSTNLSTPARVSSLGHALLGLLAREDATGYDLAQQMRHPVGYFWEAGHSQIYPELGRLEAAGLVGHAVVAGRGPLPTKRYSLTDAGRRAQVAWLEGPMRPEPSRDLQTLRTWSLWMGDAALARSWAVGRRAHHARVLRELESERAKLLADPPAPGAELWCNLAAVELGVRSRRAELDWCDWMLAEVDRWAACGTMTSR